MDGVIVEVSVHAALASYCTQSQPSQGQSGRRGIFTTLPITSSYVPACMDQPTLSGYQIKWIPKPNFEECRGDGWLGGSSSSTVSQSEGSKLTPLDR